MAKIPWRAGAELILRLRALLRARKRRRNEEGEFGWD
jgi:hypothetical protein